MAFSPSISAVVAVIAQVPFVTTPLPMTVVPSSRATVAPSSPVPVKLDRAMLVRLSLSEIPLSLGQYQVSRWPPGPWCQG